ncbi:peptidylprolyl isomerase [Aureimonas fodinaquatilis]|uniref:Parvulin-like PPIase n=1 Tax=Aureimonas fodinaquatilis TaxID=2565783 RepID=A0A5B0DZ51_9HYPH|nr:peptidyl-prolyl cis-trans isomerase [Aureimonas fodinaquatilis]KAA0970479.1 peptidylprolyl isomerase [Aureimonas fodinaquatilis]
MMNQLRRGVGSFTVKLLLGLLVLSFVVWGIADGFGGNTGSNVVLSAGKTDVTTSEYQFTHNQAMNRISQQLRRWPTPEEQAALGVDQIALSQLTTDALLDEQARILSINQTDQEVVRQTAMDPTFQDSTGNFSLTTFRSLLQNARVTEAQYLTLQHGLARRGQITGAVSSGFALPEAFTTALGVYNGESRSIVYATMAPEPESSIADPDETVLNDYFEDVSEDYASPEYRAVSFIPLVPETLFDPASITDAEIETEYQANLAEFTTPEQRQIQQIVFADTAAAEAGARELAAGRSFQDIAIDMGRSAEDVTLGFRSADQIMDAKVREAVFAATLNEPTGVVDGLFGPVILRVTDITPASSRPLEEVREDIRQQLAALRASEQATKAYEAIEDIRGSGGTLAEAAQNAGLELVTIAAVDQKGRNPSGVEVDNLVGGSDLLTALFLAELGMPTQPVNFATGSYVFFELTDITEAKERPLEEVRDAVIADWKGEEADRQLEARANALRDRLLAGESFADLAQSEGLTMQSAASLTRASGPQQIGEPATRAAFGGPLGHVATAPSGTTGQWMVLEVTEVNAPADPASSVTAELKTTTSNAARDDLLQSFIGRLQADTPVSYNQRAIQSVRGSVQ